MKKQLLIFVLFIGLIFPKNMNCQNPDVVVALQPIQELLRSILVQDAKDYNTYEKMADYQKYLKDVYDVTETIKGITSYIEVVKLLEEFACSIRGLDQLINNPKLKIPFNRNQESPTSCIFNFKYKNVLTSFSMANDMLNMTLSSLKMTTGERMRVLNNSFNQLNKTHEAIEDLKQEIILYNL